MANDVTYKRREYEAAAKWRWPMVRDVAAGSEAVKGKGVVYLPMPNPEDTSPENAARYASYRDRASFYNATGRTKHGLVGAVFRTIPTLTVPPTLEYVATDVDGAGNSIFQQSQQVLGDVLETARAFLLVDYPEVSGATSRADQLSGRVRATIAAYTAESVINWRVTRVGAEHLLSLVVIAEMHEEPDGFGVKSVEQMRVLRLEAGAYIVELWRKGQNGWAISSTAHPKQANGRPWDRIPGVFVGAQSNDATVDVAPLYDIAEINLGHYRNSADYEEAAFLVGQPQPWMSGLDEQWRDHLESKGIYLGSRSPWLLPVNGACGLMQAQPNTLAREAMDAKERQMVALGARLIERGSATKTATQAKSENAAEHSVLSLVASNVSEAYTQALQWAATFMGVSGECLYQLSQDFVEATLDSQMLGALVAAWQGGALPQSDLFRLLRKYDLVDPEKTDDQLRDELESAAPGLNLDDENGDGPPAD